MTTVFICTHDRASIHTSKCLRPEVRRPTIIAIRKYRQDHPDDKCHPECGCMTMEQLEAALAR